MTNVHFKFHRAGRPEPGTPWTRFPWVVLQENRSENKFCWQGKQTFTVPNNKMKSGNRQELRFSLVLECCLKQCLYHFPEPLAAPGTGITTPTRFSVSTEPCKG